MGIKALLTLLFRGFAPHQRGRHAPGWALGTLALVLLLLAACNDTSPAPPTNGAALDQLHWCGKQTILFQDASQSPPTVLTDWQQVKGALDFTVYLPQQLPSGSCLVSGEAIIHDKVLGSSFGVSYVLPGGDSLAFSETALGNQQASTFQCSASNGVPGSTPTPTPARGGTPTTTPGNANTLLCLGTKDKTSVVIDSSEAQKDLQTLFNGLTANVDWLPKK